MGWDPGFSRYLLIGDSDRALLGLFRDIGHYLGGLSIRTMKNQLQENIEKNMQAGSMKGF